MGSGCSSIKVGLFGALLALAAASAAGAQALDDAVVRYSFNQASGAVAVDETGMAFEADLFAGADWADGKYGLEGWL